MRNEKENFESCKYKIKAEGIHYCFDGYSNWEEIKDLEFHRLRLNYLEAVEAITNYVTKKADEPEVSEEDFENECDNELRQVLKRDELN